MEQNNSRKNKVQAKSSISVHYKTQREWWRTGRLTWMLDINAAKRYKSPSWKGSGRESAFLGRCKEVTPSLSLVAQRVISKTENQGLAM